MQRRGPTPGSIENYNFRKSQLLKEFDEDDWYPVESWGAGAKDYVSLLFDKDKNRGGRRRLLLFFWANGMPTDRARYWTLWWHYHGYTTVDRSGISSVDDVIRDIHAAQARGRPREALYPEERIWDIEEERPIGRRDLAVLDFRAELNDL